MNHTKMLYHHSKLGNLDEVKRLVEQNIGIEANEINWSLVWAAMNGHIEVIKYLVSKDADLNFQRSHALKYASLNGHLGVIKYLVEQGADVITFYDQIFKLAYINHHAEVVKYLESLN